MKTLATVFALILLVASALPAQQVQQSQQHSRLKVGDVAPEFSLDGTNSFKFKLSDFKGKKNVVVAFFPAAFTAGCTSELQNFTKENAKFTDQNTQVVMISTDFIATLNHWSKEMDANFPMLSDHGRSVTKMYDVLNEPAGIANRTTFVVDTDGKIASINEGKEALDTTGAETACSRLKHKSP